MKSTSKTVVFFGSGPVAARSLEFLLKHFTIEAVITKPQPTHHKASFPVLQIVNKYDLRAYYPTNKAELSELLKQQTFNSPVGLVVDYGIIINQDVIDYFPLGIINSHFSLLPRWRGADPITFAILNGDQETGVSLMVIVEKLDEGPLLAQTPFQIPTGYTTPQLTDSLIEISNKTLATIVPMYVAGAVQPFSQDGQPTYSRKLTKDDGNIDWRKPAESIEREIRAFLAWPKSHTTLGTTKVIITKSHVVEKINAQPGTIISTSRSLRVACGKQALEIETVKPVGKSEMSTQAFLAGNRSNL